jgi:hypothetical protein
MFERPPSELRIADELGRLPLPPEELWTRRVPRHSSWLRPAAAITGAALFVIAVALPVVVGLRESDSEGGGAASSTNAVIGDAGAIAACSGKLDGGQLVAAFTSTAGVVADWTENIGIVGAPSGPSPWRVYTATAPAYVCYFDGHFAYTRPAPAAGEASQSLGDRSLILLDETGRAVPPSKVGPRSLIAIARPGGRF